MNRSKTSRNLAALVIGLLVVGGIGYGIQAMRNRSRQPAAPAEIARPAGHAIVALTPTTASIAATAPLRPLDATAVAAVQSPATRPLANSSALLSDAKAQMEAGRLVAARNLLNGPLVSGRLSEADAEAAKKLLGEINQILVFSPRRFADDDCMLAYQVKPGERLTGIAQQHDVTWELLLRINGISDARKLRAGQWLKVPIGPFHAVVRKGSFMMEIYLRSPGESNSVYITRCAVGLGKDDSTPTGTWIVEAGRKLKKPKYYSPRGGENFEPDDPKNPLGGYWIGLSGTGGTALDQKSYGIHGTIEPESIGRMDSMGCVRLGAEDIALVWDLLVDGKSLVVVTD